MKRILIVFVAIIMLALPLSYAAAEDAVHKQLIEAADNITVRMLDVSDDENYVRLLIMSGELATEIDKALAYDYSKPTHSVILTLPMDGVDSLWREICGEEPTEAVRETLGQKLTLGIANMINGSYGSAWLATTAVTAVSDVALLMGVPEGSYLIFSVFSEDAPILLTSAVVKEDGLALMNASLVRISEEQRALLLDETKRDMALLLGGGADSMTPAIFGEVIHNVYSMEK